MGNTETSSQSVRARQRQRTETQLAEQGLTRRRLIGSSVGVGAGVLALSTGIALWPDGERREAVLLHEEVYERYREDFERIVQGDPEAERYYQYFVDHRRRGFVRDGEVYIAEGGSVIDRFVTGVMNHENTSSEDYHDKPFASLQVQRTSTKDPAVIQGGLVLMLQDAKIDPVCSGAQLAHQALHIEQMLTGFEQNRTDGFILGEHDAFSLHFRLLNKATDGRFDEARREVASDLLTGGNTTLPFEGLTLQHFQQISRAVGPIQSQEDEALRKFDLLIGLNFTGFELRYGEENATPWQVEYLRATFPLDPLAPSSESKTTA